jgi:hypothetical protein
VGGGDSVQGRVEAIRGASTAGRAGGHGAGAGVASCPARLVLGIDREEEKVRGKGAERRVPRGSETMSGRWAGGFGGLKCTGGLAVW